MNLTGLPDEIGWALIIAAWVWQAGRFAQTLRSVNEAMHELSKEVRSHEARISHVEGRLSRAEHRRPNED